MDILISDQFKQKYNYFQHQLMDIQESSTQIKVEGLQSTFSQQFDYLSYIQMKPNKYQKIQQDVPPMSANKNYNVEDIIVSIPQQYFIKKDQVPFYNSYFVKYLRESASYGYSYQLDQLLKSYKEILPIEGLHSFPLQCFLYFLQILWTDHQPHQSEEITFAHKRYAEYIRFNLLHTPLVYIEYLKNVNNSMYDILLDLRRKYSIFIMALQKLFQSQQFQQIVEDNGIGQAYEIILSTEYLIPSLLLMMPRIHDYGIIPLFDQITYSEQPNAKWAFDYETNTINLYANRSISYGQEITVKPYRLDSPQQLYSYHGVVAENSKWNIQIPIQIDQTAIKLYLSYPKSQYNQGQFVLNIVEQLLRQIPPKFGFSKVFKKIIDYAMEQYKIDRLGLLPFDAQFPSLSDEHKFKKNVSLIAEMEKAFLEKVLENSQAIHNQFIKYKRIKRQQKMLQ